jgi:hypothetical protein
MLKPRRKNPAFVVCIHNTGHRASLELHKIYRAIPDAAAEAEGDIRVVDESGEDYLYPATWFAPIQVPAAVRRTLLHAS